MMADKISFNLQTYAALLNCLGIVKGKKVMSIQDWKKQVTLVFNTMEREVSKI